MRRRLVSWKRNIKEGYFQPSAEQAVINDDLRFPLGSVLDQLLRCEAANNRHLASLLNQLDRLQCASKEGKVPAPVADQVSNDQ